MEEANEGSSKSFFKKSVPIPTVLGGSLSIFIIFILLILLIFRGNGNPKITNETLGLQVKELKELTTIQYKYKDIATREDWNTLFNIKLPFTKSSFIVSYTGILKLGIDLSETKVDVDESSKTIKVTLPEPKILSNDVDLSSLKVYDEKNSIFNPVKVKDYAEFTQSGKENAEADAKESGVFEQSKEVAKKVIIELLNTTKEIKENYKIVFE